MRSPLGELASLAGRSLRRSVRNDSPVPYVGRGNAGQPMLGGPGATGDQAAAIEAPGNNGTLFSIIDKLSTAVAALDWHMHKPAASTDATCDICGNAEDAPRGVQMVDTHPALSVWNKPNDHFTPALLVESFQQHVDLVGEGWLLIAYLGGRPIELWPVRPDRMAPVRDRKKFISGYAYRSPDGEIVPLGLHEVIYIRKPAPWDAYRGAGAAQTLMTQLYGAKYAAEWNTRFFQNSAIPGGVVEVPAHLQDAEWEELQLRWAESHKGVSNAHTVAVLEHGAKWIDTKFTQRDMEFGDLRRATREEVREAFGIHGSILGISENINLANARTGDEQFARHLTVPRGNRVKDTLNGPFLRLWDKAGLGAKQGYAFAYANPVPADREGDNAERESKANAFATLVNAGVDPAEAAEVCGLPPLTVTKPEPQPQPALTGAPGGGNGGAGRNG